MERGTGNSLVTRSARDAEYIHRVINLFDRHVVTENIKNKFHV